MKQSSLIKSARAQGQDLVVEFVSGGQYTYRGAAQELANLQSAASQGRYFNQAIAPRYSFVQS